MPSTPVGGCGGRGGGHCCESCSVVDSELHLQLCSMPALSSLKDGRVTLILQEKKLKFNACCMFPKLVVLASIHISFKEKITSRQFSNFSGHETHLGCPLKCRSLCPTPRILDSVGAQEYACIMISSPHSTHFQ